MPGRWGEGVGDNAQILLLLLQQILVGLGVKEVLRVHIPAG